MRTRAYLAGAPVGYCESPRGRTVPSDRVVSFSGWALSRPGRDVPRVEVRQDGVVLAGVRPDGRRPDVARLYGRRAVVSGWSADVAVGVGRAASGIEVVAVDGRGETVLARYRLGPASASAAADAGVVSRVHGSIDHPEPGQVLGDAVVNVFGWVGLDGEPADVVEVYLDDRPALRARRCDARADLAGIGVFPDSTALVAGYSALIVLPEVDRPRGAVVRVAARSMNGTVWTPPPVPIRIQPRSSRTGAEPMGPIGALQHVVDRGVEVAVGRPRVCVFTHSLRLGGGELYLQELLLRLADARVADFLVVTPEDGALRPALEQAGIEVHITAGYAVDAGRYAARLAELAALMASWRTDVALVNTLGVFPAADAARRLGVPVVWSIHESFPLEVFSLLNWGPAGLHPTITQAWRRALAEADEVVFESEATRQLFAAEVPGLTGRCIRYGIDPSAISVYEDAHDRDEVRAGLGFGREHRVLLCMGVYLDRKSQLALVHAFADLAALHPNARLILVGDHPSEYAQVVHRLVAERGVTESVRLEPIDPDTYRWYRSADALVSASDTESLPRSVLEAMTFGVPILAADVFGLSEVVTDGVNGWLCEARSGVSLLAGLQRVLQCPADELAEMSASARADAKAFDGQGYASAYHQLIAQLAERQRSTRGTDRE